MPKKLRKELAADEYYTRCARESEGDCEGRITFEHAWIYAGKQIQERWAILPLCWYHHLGAGLNKALNQFLSLQNATAGDLKKYPRTNWVQIIKSLKAKFL